MQIAYDGISADLIPEGDMVVEMYKRYGEFESECLKEWVKMQTPGTISLDIGAYTGIYSIFASKMGIPVLAFEPHLANRNRAIMNMVRNKCEGVMVSDVAIGNPPLGHEMTKFEFNGKMGHTSGGRLHGVKHPNTSYRATDFTPVDCYSLDIIILLGILGKEWPGKGLPVGAMKIDVEGGEIAVLEGATGVFERDRPSVICEILTPKADREIMAFFDKLGYLARELDDRNFAFRPEETT